MNFTWQVHASKNHQFISPCGAKLTLKFYFSGPVSELHVFFLHKLKQHTVCFNSILFFINSCIKYEVLLQCEGPSGISLVGTHSQNECSMPQLCSSPAACGATNSLPSLADQQYSISLVTKASSFRHIIHFYLVTLKSFH